MEAGIRSNGVETQGGISRTLIGNEGTCGPGMLLSLEKSQENMKVVSKSLRRGTTPVPRAARS